MKLYALLALALSSLTAQTPAAPPPTPPASKTSLETITQKQRETTLAAMQAAVEKQKAAVKASVAASIGKQGQSLAGNDSFFTLAPLTPPQPQPSVSMPDVACDPVPEESVAPVLLGAAQRESLDPKLLTAVIQQESGFRPCAISDKGAQGLMQLMPDTADRFSVKDPFDTKQNVDAGAKYLKELITKYSGNLALALSAYNAGPETVDKAGGVPDIPETTDYVKSILTKLGIELPAAKTDAPAAITDPVPPAAPQQ